MKYFNSLPAFSFVHLISKRLMSSKDLIVRPEYLTKLRECYRLEETQHIVVPQFKRALLYGNNIAVKDYAGEYTYFQLYMQSKRLSRQIANICDSCSSSTIGLFYSNDVLSILCLWACWMAGQVVMPLIVNHQCTYADLPSLLIDAKVKLIINAEHQKLDSSLSLANALGISHITIDHLFMKQQNHAFNLKREVFIADNLIFFEGLLQNNFYTKAIALFLYYKTDDEEHKKWKIIPVSHKELDVQMKIFVQTWNITPDDRVLSIFSNKRGNTLVECTSGLNKGCCLHMLEPYESTNAWSLLMGINMPVKDRVNVLVAEPEIYQDLIVEYDKIFAKNARMVEYIKEYCSSKMRLMISCFDKLSTETYARWLEITGHSLFENCNIYGNDMLKKVQTEWPKGNNEFDITNMALSAGSVKFRIVDSANNILLECNGKSLKKLYTSSPTIVGSLWIATTNCSENDNDACNNEDEMVYFSTGDVVMYQDGTFKFLGHYSQQK